MIEYHEKPGAPGMYFSCPYGLGTLSTDFCAELHKKSKTKEFISEHRRKECRFCPVGALHAGERGTMSGSRLYGSLLCSRCLRVSSRLVAGRCCVSCYNRFWENKKNKNSKGNPLKLIRTYCSVNLLLINESTVSLRKVDNVMNMTEAIVSVLLNESSGSVVFGWVGYGVIENAG